MGLKEHDGFAQIVVLSAGSHSTRKIKLTVYFKRTPTTGALMQAFLDLSDGAEPPVAAKVLAILFFNEKQLFACTTILDGAAWFGLIHEDSDALISIETEV